MSITHTDTLPYKPPFKPFTMNVRGRLVEVERPWVTAIINATPDSFYSASRALDESALAALVRQHLDAGADMLDIGACSTRPGSQPPSPQEEIARLRTAMQTVRRLAPDIPVSVDTWRADVAREAVEALGADIVNDISGGDLDPEMAQTVASLKVPYIIMHTRGTPADMADQTDYPRGAAADVIETLSRKVFDLRLMGIGDIIADPGFGFAKTAAQSYELLRELPRIVATLGVPVMAGLSRKSMLWQPLQTSADDSLAATVAANTLALSGGAAFIRVHDVLAARQARDIVQLTFPQQPNHA